MLRIPTLVLFVLSSLGLSPALAQVEVLPVDHLRKLDLQLALELVDLDAVQGLDRQQRVDEEAIAARGGHAAGRGMRAGDEAHVLEVGHHVADACRRKVEARQLGQGARTDRLAVGDVALDQGLQQQLRAFVESLWFVRHAEDSTQKDRCISTLPAGAPMHCF